MILPLLIFVFGAVCSGLGFWLGWITKASTRTISLVPAETTPPAAIVGALRGPKGKFLKKASPPVDTEKYDSHMD
jgi:hypothetical protein